MACGPPGLPKGSRAKVAEGTEQAAAPARLVDRLLAGAGATGSLCACANRGDRLARCSPDHREHPAAVTPFPRPIDDRLLAVHPQVRGEQPAEREDRPAATVGISRLRPAHLTLVHSPLGCLAEGTSYGNTSGRRGRPREAVP